MYDNWVHMRKSFLYLYCVALVITAWHEIDTSFFAIVGKKFSNHFKRKRTVGFYTCPFTPLSNTESVMWLVWHFLFNWQLNLYYMDTISRKRVELFDKVCNLVRHGRNRSPKMLQRCEESSCYHWLYRISHRKALKAFKSAQHIQPV